MAKQLTETGGGGLDKTPEGEGVGTEQLTKAGGGVLERTLRGWGGGTGCLAGDCGGSAGGGGMERTPGGGSMEIGLLTDVCVCVWLV